MLLGEAASKCDHLSKVPLRPDTHQRLHRIYLAKGAMATTAIEGNTLSEEEVLKAVDGELHLPPSKQYLQQEVENVIAACNWITNEIAAGQPIPLTVERLLELNRAVLAKLPLQEDVRAGEIRRHPVVVGKYRGAPAEDCLDLLSRLCAWLEGPDLRGGDSERVAYALLRAVIAHLYLAWIHPFGDGNGRTARLLEFQILLTAGIPSPAAHLLSNHYNESRSEYYRQLDQASRSGGDVVPFLHYAVQGFVDGLRTQLDFVWSQQWDVVWRNFVHELFESRNSPADARQRHLALDLGSKNDWVTLTEIPELSTRLARAYASRTAKTVQRDLVALEKLGLLVREARRVRARRELIFAFLPVRVETKPQEISTPGRGPTA